MLENMKKIDKKLLAMMGVVIGVIVIIMVLVIVVSLTSGGSISYSKIENKIVSAAEKYYKDNDSSLPKEIGETVEVDVETLVSGGYIKDLSEYTDENIVCSGKAIVAKTSKSYDYVADLDCGDAYKTTFLADKIIENVTSTGNGLYKMEDVVEYGSTLGIDEDGYDLASNELMKGYIYRGELVDNYIKIDGTLYRIIKIDGNKDITVVSTDRKAKSTYDNRYNAELDKNYGINDYTMSRAYEKLTSVYDALDDDTQIKTKGVGKNICIGGRTDDDTSTDGSIECSVVMKNQFYGLIPMFDIMNASLSDSCTQTNSKDCANYNYLVDGKNSFWTLTPSSENTYNSYFIDTVITAKRSSTSTMLKYVYFLSNRLVYESGTGTESDPYIVK